MDRRFALVAILLLLPSVAAQEAAGPDVRLRLVDPPAEASAGRSAVFLLEIENRRAENVTVVARPNESTGTFPVRSDLPFFAQVQPGVTPFRVTLDVPADATPGDYLLRVDLDTPWEPTLATSVLHTVRVTPPRAPAVAFAVDAPASVEAGMWRTISATVRNVDSVGFFLDLSANETSAGGRATVLPSVAFLQPGESRDLSVNLEVPGSATGQATLVLEARTSRSPATTHTTTFEITPRQSPTPMPPPTTAPTRAPTPEPPANLFVRPLGAARLTAPDAYEVDVTLENLGRSGAIAELRLAAADGSLDAGARSERVQPGETRTVTITARFAEPLPPGRHDLVLVARISEDASYESRHLVPLEVPLPPAARLEVTPSAADLQVPQGGAVTGTILVRNPTARALDVAVSTGDLTLRPGLEHVRVSWRDASFRLAPGESRSVEFVVEVTPGASVGAGSAIPYRVTVREGASAPRTQSEALAFRVVEGAESAPARDGLAMGLAVGAGGVAVAGVAAIPFLRREWWRYLAAVPFVGLYTRLRKSELLDHATRERVHALIQARPGIHYSALKEETRLNTGALVHHLRTLERHGLVTSRREGPLRCFYPVGARLPPPPVRLSAVQQRILDILEEGPMSQRALGERLGMTQQGVSYQIRTLERKGCLVLEREAGEWRAYVVRETQPIAPEAQA